MADNQIVRLTHRPAQAEYINLDEIRTHFIITPQGNIWRWIGPDEEQPVLNAAAAEDLEQALEKALNPEPWTSFTDIFDKAKQALYVYRYRTVTDPQPCTNVSHDEINCADAKTHWTKWCDNCWGAAQSHER